MNARDRRVRVARLRASSDALVRRGALLLEDALRTASLPGADGARVVLVRRLDVGAIRGDAAAGTVALTLEARLAHAAADAVHADAPGAAQANAVFFRDAVEPLAMLAARVARGAPADEWFWRRVAPAGAMRDTPGGRLVALLHAAAAHAAGAAAALRVLRAVDESGARGMLLAALTPGDGATLLARSEWRWPEPRQAPVAMRDGSPGATGAAVATVTAWLRGVGWDRDDARARWLACMAVALARPWRATGDPTLPLDAAAALHASARAADRGLDANAPPAREYSAHDATTAHEVPPQMPDAPTRTPSCGAARPSAHAGLLLLVPLLARLGLPAALDAEPALAARGLARALLDRAAARLGAPRHDPARRALDDPSRTTVDGFDAAPADRALLARWLRAMRTHAVVVLGVPLREIVARRGRVRATATHVDVYFDHRAVDLRLRRAALDVDPGWVPWLGRVVLFHYVADTDDVG